MPADVHADIVIVGGAGMGSAVAYFLKVLGPANLRVVVCEPDPKYERAATTLSAGGIRQQFSTAENILLSQFGQEFLLEASASLTIGDDPAPVDFHPLPYLHLVAGDAETLALRQSFELQARLGAGSTWLDRAELRTRFPWMALDDVDAGVLGGPREGLFDPYGLVQALRRKAMQLGAEYRPTAVTGIALPAADAPCADVVVALADGSTLACARVINCAGPWANRIAAMAGLSLPVIPVRAHTFVFKAETPPALHDFPAVVDTIQLLNFRPEGTMFLAGSPREGDLADAGDNFDIDYDLFDTVLWPILATRVPAFEAIRMVNAWVGHMEWSTLDANAIIGPHTRHPQMVFANGFSGHGAQHCPGVGRAVAELLLDGAYKSLDLSRFSYERILANRPVTELY